MYSTKLAILAVLTEKTEGLIKIPCERVVPGYVPLRSVPPVVCESTPCTHLFILVNTKGQKKSIKTDTVRFIKLLIENVISCERSNCKTCEIIRRINHRKEEHGSNRLTAKITRIKIALE